MNTSLPSKFEKLGFSLSDPATQAALKSYIKPVGIGAGIGALGMGAADLMGSHDDEPDYDRTTSLLKSMAMGGVMGGGIGAAAHAMPQIASMHGDPVQKALAGGGGGAGGGAEGYDAWNVPKSMAHHNVATGLGTGTVAQLAANRMSPFGGGMGAKDLATKPPKDITFNHHDLSNPNGAQQFYNEQSKTIAPQIASGTPQKDIFKGISSAEEAAQEGFRKSREGLSQLAPRGAIGRDALKFLRSTAGPISFADKDPLTGKSQNFSAKASPFASKVTLPGQGGNAQVDPLPNVKKVFEGVDPKNMSAFKARELLGSRADYLGPLQKMRAFLQNNIYAPIRNTADVIKGENPFTVSKGQLNPMKVDYNNMSGWTRGFGDKNMLTPEMSEKINKLVGANHIKSKPFGSYSRHMYQPESQAMKFLESGKMPLSYGRGHWAAGPVTAAATMGGLGIADKWMASREAKSLFETHPEVAERVRQMLMQQQTAGQQ